MPKLQIKATELQGTSVDFVSLVKRGANRIPFRVTKEDNQMLDLYKLGRTIFSKADAKPEIVAAIVSNSTALEQVGAIFKSAGIDTTKFFKSEKDGVITVAVKDADKAEDTFVLKMNDDVAVVVANATELKKVFKDWDLSSTSFGDIMATGGFCSSMSTATDMLRHTVANVLYEAQTPDEAAEGIQKAVSDFGKFAVTLAKGLPVHAFKMDVDLARMTKADKGDESPVETKPAASDGAETTGDEIEKADKTKAKDEKNGTGAGFEKGKGTGTDDEATADDKANTAVNKTKAKKAVHPGLPDPKGYKPGDLGGFAQSPTDSDEATARASADDKKLKQNGGTSGSTIPDGQSGITVHKDGEGADETAAEDKNSLNDVLAAIAGLKKSLEDSVTAINGDVKNLTKRVDTLNDQVKKTDAALNGTVFNDAGGDHEERTTKSEATGAPPLLDTAYHRRSAA